MRDHLGNTRVMVCDGNKDGTPFKSNGYADIEEITQINHYYPFGMNMEGPWNGSNTAIDLNKYQYNGKELNDDFGLNWNDYGARWYDSAIGRWNGIDPLAEKYKNIAPYTYVADNPLKFIDPDGKDIVDPKGKHVTITYNKDGSLNFSKNATADIKRVANAMNLTATGKAQLKKIDQSDIHVKINISDNAKIVKAADGKTSYTYGETMQGNRNVKDDYGKKQNADGTYGIKEATITIFEGTIKEGIKQGSGLKHEGLSLEQAIGAVAAHEGVHATDKKEIHKDISAEQSGKARIDNREIAPNKIEHQVIEQSKNQ